jgi:sulfur-carrier protein
MSTKEERAQDIEIAFNGLLNKYFRSDKVQSNFANIPTIRSLLEKLCVSSEHRQRIFEADGNVRSDITILKNGRNIVFLEGLDTGLNGGDKVAIFPPVCGG